MNAPNNTNSERQRCCLAFHCSPFVAKSIYSMATLVSRDDTHVFQKFFFIFSVPNTHSDLVITFQTDVILADGSALSVMCRR